MKSSNLVYTKFELDGLLRGDTAARNASFTAGRQGGWYSQNDVRELLDMNPIPDGDVYTTTPAGAGANPEPAPTNRLADATNGNGGTP